MDNVKIVECPRDAWQGLPKAIPTEVKIAYLRRLIGLGFRHLDAASFVAAKRVPQMADSEIVVKALSMEMAVGLTRQRATTEGAGLYRQSPAEAQAPAPLTAGQPLEIIGIVVNDQGLDRATVTGSTRLSQDSRRRLATAARASDGRFNGTPRARSPPRIAWRDAAFLRPFTS